MVINPSSFIHPATEAPTELSQGSCLSGAPPGALTSKTSPLSVPPLRSGGSVLRWFFRVCTGSSQSLSPRSPTGPGPTASCGTRFTSASARTNRRRTSDGNPREFNRRRNLRRGKLRLRAGSGRTRVASGRTGVRAKAATPLRARNSVRHPKRAFSLGPYRPLQSLPRAVSSVSDRVRLHLVGDVVGLTDREGHDRQRRVLGPAGRKLTAVRDEQVRDVERLAVTCSPRRHALSRSSG